MMIEAEFVKRFQKGHRSDEDAVWLQNPARFLHHDKGKPYMLKHGNGKDKLKACIFEWQCMRIPEYHSVLGGYIQANILESGVLADLPMDRATAAQVQHETLRRFRPREVLYTSLVR